MGFMLGAEWFSLFGPDTEHAFGHVGFTNVVAWADPERQVAAAIMTTGKPVVYPQIYFFWDVMRQIGLACPKDRRGPLRSVTIPAATEPPRAAGDRLS
jgi:CubicO group peptidase (beta-lactamase class C family)